MRKFATSESRPATAWRWSAGAAEPIARDLADEVPVGLAYGGRPHVVLMATPADYEDLAVGFTVSEGIAPATDIAGIRVGEQAEGVTVDVTLAPAAGRRPARRRRTMEGRSGCGLCGVERLSEAVRSLAPLGEGLRLDRDAIGRALVDLADAQTLGRKTRATHAAALADRAGRLLLVREDVGRHNALDKAIGAAAREGLPPAVAFALITSRCSYEMVEKAATAGIAVLVAISAPTALAIRKAEEAGLTLVALARDDGHAVFTRADRIVDRVPA